MHTKAHTTLCYTIICYSLHVVSVTNIHFAFLLKTQYAVLHVCILSLVQVLLSLHPCMCLHLQQKPCCVSSASCSRSSWWTCSRAWRSPRARRCSAALEGSTFKQGKGSIKGGNRTDMRARHPRGGPAFKQGKAAREAFRALSASKPR